MIKIKNKKGSALITTLIVMLFLGILGTMIYNSSTTEMKIASNISAKNLKFQAAEESISIAINNQFATDTGIDEAISLSDDESIRHCSDNGTEKKGTACDDVYTNNDKTIKSFSDIKLNADKECLSYGNSDQKAHCFLILGNGQIPLLNNDTTINVQEVQVTTINANNNGVYEF